MPQSKSVHNAATSAVQAVTKTEYLSLASYLEGKESAPRVHKKVPHGAALRQAGERYENREYVAAYESFKPVYEKVVSDMQRILARNVEFEANKLAKQQQKPLAVAKENIQNLRSYAQQVIVQFDRLLQDLESKALVRVHIKSLSQNRPQRGGQAHFAPRPSRRWCPPQNEPVPDGSEEAPPTSLNSASETRLDANAVPPVDVVSGDRRYKKASYSPPEMGSLYCVRDKAKGERIIRVIGKSSDGALVQVEILEDGKPSKHPIQLTVDSLASQAAKGWCSLLLPVAESGEAAAAASQPAASNTTANATMRLDIQNFGRCCADIARANLKFDTQRIKDVGDGPFRAGDYEQAFLTFEQFATGFTAAVSSSRQAIADGRRALTAEKSELSGKEIQERSAAFIRSEHLIHAAERAFSTILEGLRMYLRAQQP